ncbi:cytochrome P450 [Microbacterium sp. AG790]|uniref:cytochrome P450 n=2 Tax=unclassified Microbacterium TaxID=2609290 RepID=UPI000EB0B742|nr:cytochrome P450 [Microbacterium sp. AG790]RKS86743.1 cytochrome P450 [Microbacterium sp. AG790]
MITPFATAHPVSTDIDISSLAFWSKPFDVREESFRRLRHEAPVSWHEPFEVPGYDTHGEQGFWALARAEDITAVSLDNETFVSRFGVSIAPSPLEIQQLASFFLAMDPPQHSIYRRLVGASFTPKAIARLTDKIAERARDIVARVRGAGDIDFVEDVAALLPMMTVCDLIGIPEEQQQAVRHAADAFVSDSDPVELPEGMTSVTYRLSQAFFLHQVGAELAAHRRRHPSDDLMTDLVQGEVDGKRLTDEEIGAFMVLMSVAGNDTTKQTTTRTVMSLDANPDQRDWLMEDFDGRINGSIEEFVRHASPVMTFARTATRDTEIRGVPIAEGDKVGLLYCSGNRDETVFDDPARFDLRRGRSPHVGFGGGGVHYCLGNGVAKTQLRAIFNELLNNTDGIEVGEPDFLVGNFINGVKHLPARVS